MNDYCSIKTGIDEYPCVLYTRRPVLLASGVPPFLEVLLFYIANRRGDW